MKRTIFLVLLVLGIGGIWSFSQMGGGMGYMGHEMNENLVFPHLAAGSGYTASIFLMNPGQSTAPVDGTLYFFDQAGSPLVMDDGNQTADHFAIQLAPGTTWYRDFTSGNPGLTVGWAFFDVTSSGGGMGGMMDNPHNHVFGTVIYTHSSGGTLDTQVGVLGSRYEMGYYMGMAVPVLAGGSLNTGVAVVNTWSAAGTVTLRLRDLGWKRGAGDEPDAQPRHPDGPVRDGDVPRRGLHELQRHAGNPDLQRGHGLGGVADRRAGLDVHPHGAYPGLDAFQRRLDDVAPGDSSWFDEKAPLPAGGPLISVLPVIERR